MPNQNDKQPLIIKKKKSVIADGHHGGAWKVAYADFVTAMMAFFLLMWLLNATTESQRKGIADFFAPSIPISRVSGGGDDVLAGDSVFADDTLIKDGTGGEKRYVPTDRKGRIEAETPPGEGAVLPSENDLSDVDNKLRGMSGESDAANDLLEHIRTRVTDEGLIIDVFAREGKPLFDLGSFQPTPRMERLLDMIGEVIGLISNQIAVTGHTDGLAYSETDYDNWDLSLARANETRRQLVVNGIESGQFARVVGKADRDLALPETPLDPRNRRISITLLRSDLQ